MIQGAFNQGFTNFCAEKEAAKKLVNVERCEIYTWETEYQIDSQNARIDLNDKVEGTIPILRYDSSKQLTLPDNFKADLGIATLISSKEDELRAVGWANRGVSFIACKTTDWKIIPFENLIAKLSTLDTALYAEIGNSLKDAELLIHTLESGVDGLIFTPDNENSLIDLKKLLKTTLELPITTGKIEKITSIPEADRVCVDTSSMLRAGEGMLVGNTAKGFALVHAEVFDSEFVNSRPFRVNAGDVSAYILVPKDNPDGSTGFRTNYLSELKAGDRVLVVNTDGETRIVSVGRVKIETRPMLLFNVSVMEGDVKIPLVITVQNAETIRLIEKSGKPMSVTDMKVGDEFLVNKGPGATHFGTKIKETIIEK
jgi:3-dehydroquinate synthase II